MSWTLTSQAEKYSQTGGWSGVYQSVDSAEWWTPDDAAQAAEELADLTLLSGAVTVAGAQ